MLYYAIHLMLDIVQLIVVLRKNESEIMISLIPSYKNYNLIVTSAISIMFELTKLLNNELDLQIDKNIFSNYEGKLEKYSEQDR